MMISTGQRAQLAIGDIDEQQDIDSPSFIVHNYTRTPSTSDVIGAGCALINYASLSAGWTNVGRDSTTNFSFSHRDNVFGYARRAPLVTGREEGGTRLREWGEAAEDDEVFRMEDLDEFESTDFQLACDHPPQADVDLELGREIRGAAGSVAGPMLTRKLSLKTADLDEPKSKRKRLDDSPLHHLIPQPHFHLPPSDPPSSVPPRIPPYTKSNPTPFGAHTASSIQDFILSDSRSAWIVPVRGILPWQGSTTASILQSRPVRPLDRGNDVYEGVDLPSGVADTGEIVWTHGSLLSFWNFLLALRQARTLGHLSISFHAAPSHAHAHSRSYSSPEYSFSSGLGPGVAYSDSHDGHLCRMPLLAVDHIKVYHDVGYAMFLRNVWDAWGFELREDAVEGQRKGGAVKGTKKVRVLKGAKLVLVDERSKAVLLS